jgi:crotonobetainyl-CoA:carnitine CoA-transferase CaiB-like acyl-CoA transferase
MSVEALSGIKVLDFGQYIAGPLAGMMLAEQGAEVTKIERPQGDPFRKDDGFMVYNRSKKNIVLDLKKPEGQKIALDLVKEADILIENFKPGVMDKLGLGYETVITLNPRLIYCSISGFGDKGPYSQIPGYEQLVETLATMYTEQGYATRPAYLVLPLASLSAGLDAAYSIVAALCVRETTGRGQKIDITLFKSTLSLCRGYNIDFSGMYRMNWVPTGSSPVYRIFKCADGKHLFLAVGNFKFVTMFLLAIGREDLLASDLIEGTPFLSLPPKSGQLMAQMKKTFLTRTRDEWIELLLSNGIPAAPVQTTDEYMKYEQIKANGMIKTIRQPGKGMVTQMGIPIKPSLTPGSIKGPATRAGQHTAAILRHLGYRADDVRRLKRERVIK